MTSISKSKLKANMFRIFREIEESGEDLIVTRHSRPVPRIQAIDRKNRGDDVFGTIQGKVIYREGISAPTAGEWLEP